MKKFYKELISDTTTLHLIQGYDYLGFIEWNQRNREVIEANEKILNASEKFVDMKFKVDYVSNITTKIVNDIMKTNECLLPTIQDSYHSHVELFQIFNKHLEKITNQEIILCPIT